MYLTQSKGTFDDSDEVSLSRTSASRACQGPKGENGVEVKAWP